MVDNPDNGASRIIADLADTGERFDRDLLEQYIDELLSWNDMLGLVSHKATGDVITSLIRRSVLLWDTVLDLATPRRAADIGSGGGFPGVVWSMLAPGLDVYLIERKSRRAVFLERLGAMLGTRTQVVEADVREAMYDPALAGSFDVVAMLAVKSPTELALPLEALLNDSGLLANTRPLDELPAPATVGAHLSLLSDETTDAGRVVLYQKKTT